MSVHEVLPMKKFIIALAVIFLGSVTGYAQNTPTLALAAGKVGISSNGQGRASNFEFQMEASGWPRAVTAGETVFMMGSWPNGNNPTITDDKSNTWASAISCNDGTNMNHGFFYAINAAANTSMITETHSSAIGNGVFDWAHFYNMSTTSSGFVDGSACRTGVTPSSNTAPNISGTAYTTATNGDLILTCVYFEQNPLATPNPITSITWPTGFVGLSEETYYGHACAYGVQTTAGSFTPTFTVAQGTHNSFTILSAAFKAGSGGTAPGNGASILLSEMHYVGSSGRTDAVYLPCPSGTTNIAILDDAGSMTSVTDNNSNTWSHVSVPGNYYGPIFYTNNPTISNGNTYTVSMTFGDTGNWDLVGLFCIGGTGGVDTAATAENGSTLDGTGSGATYNGGTLSDTTLTNAPSIGTSVAGDLVLSVGAIGTGPATACIAGQCVFDYVGSTNWSNGDNESYANGDLMAHQHASTASTVDFEYNDIGSAGSGIAIALKPASSATPVITSATTASGTVGSAFSYQIAATNSPTSYAATGLPAGLSVSTASGLISGTPTAAGTSTVTISATNSSGTGSATLTLTIALASPVITSATTANGTVGSAFSNQIVATNSPTSYGATGLPAGLSVSTTSGLISGTPTAAGTSTVTISATNSGGTGSASLTLTVTATAQSPVITSATTASGTVGSAFSYQIVASNSPTSYAATGLPAGLSVSTTSGLISGTPTAAGTSTVTLSATNSAGTGSATLTLTIASQTTYSACDVNKDGLINVLDVQIAVDNYMSCPTTNFQTFEPQVITGVLSSCPVTSGFHTVSLNWTASTTSGVTYSVYRATTSGGYNYSAPLATGISGTSYADCSVALGQTYYYVVEAVSGTTQSANSNEMSVTIPAT